VPVLILIVVPYVNGTFRPEHLQPLGLPGGIGLTTFGGISLIFYWMYIAGWSSYAFEAVAIHAPEYRDTLRDTPRALRSSSLFSVLAYGLVPLGLMGALGQQAIAAHVLTPFDLALKSILGGVFGTLIVIMVLAALILSANMAAIASVRALWQMSENGLSVTTFSRLNRWGEPDVAILFTYGINIVLIWTVGSPLWILAASNAGYILSHIVALAGFILLRRDQPNAVRPIKLGPRWVYTAGALAALNLTFMVVGAPLYGLQPLFAGLAIFLVASTLLYAVRRYLQDPRSAPAVAT
jgi:amino acid transporter